MAPSQPVLFANLSQELLCHILQYLPLKEVLSISMLCKKLSIAADMHLRLRKYIDFCEGTLYGYMSPTITDEHLHTLFIKCPQLETIYGLHPLKVERRRLRKRSALTLPGIMDALCLCRNLKAVEISDLKLFEAILQNLPKIEIIGHFRNRDGVFPPQASHRLKLQPFPCITSLHLIGVEVPELTKMPSLEHLHLQCVRFTKLQPFRAFIAQNLKTFVMKHCMGPTMALRYLSLILALSAAPALSRLELVRVPLLSGLFQRAVEDSYRNNGFVNLKTIIIAGCKGIQEADVGHLMIVAARNLETVFVQPSLTKDSLFVSLSFAHCEFPMFKSIHLGYVDKLNTSVDWSTDALVSHGLADVPDTPSSLTDCGMKVIGKLFPNLKSLSISNCPHLMAMDQWSDNVEGEEPAWRELTDLTLHRCHCLKLSTFALFIAFLPKIEVVLLNDMFREPPKGCSHVGLSAGTGLGMSSAVVSNQDEHIAVQGHQQDFEIPDENMENDDRDQLQMLDGDFEEEDPDQHIRVLQQEFFDDERRIAPPPVRHRDDIDPVDMPQNDQENHIRRELNDDYDVALNVEIRQDGNAENSNEVPVEEAVIKDLQLPADKNSKPEEIPLVNDESSDNPGEVLRKDSLLSVIEDSKSENIPFVKAGNSDELGDKPLQNSSQLSDKVSEPEVIPFTQFNPGEVLKKDSLLSVIEDSKSENIPFVKAGNSDELDDKPLQNSSQLSDKVSEPEVIPFTNHQPSDSKSCYDKNECKLVSSDDKEGLQANSANEVDKPLMKEITRKKQVGNLEKKCNHSRKCRNKCSKGFDPSQPSTSRGGNCLDCACVEDDVVDGTRVSSNQESEEKVSSAPPKGEIVQSKKRNFSQDSNIPIRKYCTFSDSSDNNSDLEHNFADDNHNLEEKSLKGPLTRQQNQVLNADIEKELFPSTRQGTRVSSNQESEEKVSSAPPKREIVKSKKRKFSLDSDDPIRKYCTFSDSSDNSDLEHSFADDNLNLEEGPLTGDPNQVLNADIEKELFPSTRQGTRVSSNQESEEKVSSTPPKGEIVQSKKRKFSVDSDDPIKKYCTFSDSSDNNSDLEHNFADDTHNLEEKSLKGPLTRHQNQVLNADIEKELFPSTRLGSKRVAQNDSTSSSVVGGSKKLKSSEEKEQNADSNESKIVSTLKSSDSESKKKIVDKTNPSINSKVEETEANADEKNKDNLKGDDKNKDNPNTKKHRKHKHKRCKKKKCEKLCHKPITRSKKKRHPREDNYFVSQGTQATSSDIRRCLRKQRACASKCKRRACNGNHRRSLHHISARYQFKRPIQCNTDTEMHSKSTSTSDPLMEDDAVQVLRLVSESLISLTIIACGISDLVIDHCHSLTHIEAQACRILKMLQLHYIPSLKRLNVSQCPKLELDAIIPEVISLEATRKLLVSFEPCMQIYNPVASEKAIFSKTPFDQSVILFHDFTSNANENLQAVAKENLFRWMEVVQRMCYHPSFWLSIQKKKRVKCKDSKMKYPYGHNLRRIHGVFPLPASVDPDDPDQLRYQILTNDHVFASALEIIPWDDGFPPPESGYTEDEALLSMIETELSETKAKLRKKMTTFYVPVNESNSIAQ